MTLPENKVGRPLKFATDEELKAAIDLYFSERTLTIVDGAPYQKPLTMSGLARALDVDRKTLLNYSYRDEFFPTVARARAKCEEYAEEQLFVGKNSNGAKFALTNNYDGWEDKTKSDIALATHEQGLKELHAAMTNGAS